MIYNSTTIKEKLICEFEHYDLCRSGLILDGDKYKFFKVYNILPTDVLYRVYDINWTLECDEYLQDYKTAFYYWFYEDGVRRHHYKGEDQQWFRKKWPYNAIKKNIINE